MNNAPSLSFLLVKMGAARAELVRKLAEVSIEKGSADGLIQRISIPIGIAIAAAIVYRVIHVRHPHHAMRTLPRGRS
jgi:hypothetical protein